MYSQFFSSPTIVNLSMPTRLCLSLPDSVSDFVLSEALRSPLLEWVMLEGEDKASQGQFILRLQPFLTQQLLPLESVRRMECRARQVRALDFTLKLEPVLQVASLP